MMIQTYTANDLPHGIRIGIYGTGKRGRIEKDIIEQTRKDIKIAFFLDSFSRGEVDGYDVLKPTDLLGKENIFDMILICSAYSVDMLMYLVDLEFPDSKIAISAISDDFFPRTCLISEEHNFIFVPIGKVASMSFLKLFSNYCPRGLQNIDYRSTKYKNYHKFAFVRNPYDRFVSCFSFMSSVPEFKRFLSYLTGKDNYSFQNMLKSISNMKDGASHPLWASQSLTLCNSSNQILVDSIYKLEYLQDALTDLQERLGIKLNIPHLNASKRDDYKNYYAIDEKEVCSQRYARDLQNFSYNFNADN